ncbi:MAG: aspartate--tRNA(Asn) ligase [Candidatus Woesearchaeota archaeon]
MIDLARRIYSSEALKKAAGTRVVVAGWAADIKRIGKIAFVRLRDREGEIQLTALPDFEKMSELEKIPKESVIVAEGKMAESKLKSGEKELVLEKFEVISKSEPVLPIDFSGKIPTGLDKRLDNRLLDLRNRKNLAIFKIRSGLNAAIRAFLNSEGFIEIQTPKLISAGAEGGATLFQVNYYGKKVFLSQSQQLYKQAVLASGFDKVFEIGPSFRAEKSHTTRHLTEFTHFDLEMAFIKDEEDVLRLLERLFVFVIGKIKSEFARELGLFDIHLEPPQLPFPRIRYSEALDMLKEAGSKIKEDEDIGAEDEKLLGELVKKRYGTKAYFITKFPFKIKPFYIMAENGLSRSFDFEYGGEELASGGQREHRYIQLVEQMKGKGLDPKDFAFYLEAFRYGMPPHGGFGLGIDRLVKNILGLGNIREGVLFPRDPERVVP